MDWKQLGKAAKRAAASIEDAARKAAPHIEEAAAKAAAHIEEAAAKAKPHLEDAARKTRAAAKEAQKRIDRNAAKRLLGGVLKDWLDGDILCGNYGDIDWIDEDDESAAEAKPTTGASIAVSLRKGEIKLRRVQLKARSLDAVGAPGLYLVSGSVDHAKIVLPWAQLAGSKPAKVEIGALSLRLRATRDDDTNSTAVEASAKRREDSLEAMRAQWTAFAEQTAARRLDKTEWKIKVDEASVAWEIPGGVAQVMVQGATATGASTAWVLGCRAAALSVNNDAPVRLTPTTCSLTVADAIQLNFGPIALQARPAETAALIRCVCGLDTLAAPARACIKLRAFAPKVTVETAPDRRSWTGLADVRLDDEAVAVAEPLVVVVEAVEVSVTSSTDTLAVAATAKTTTVGGAVVSDLAVQASDDNVVVRAVRADADVDGRALASIIEVTTSIQTGFACRAWDYLGVARADVEGEAVDFFAVETERTTAISVDAVSGTWDGVKFRGHVSSDGSSCTAVLEAARNGAQLLEPTLVQITADGVSLTNATDADAPLDVYAAPSDIRSIMDAAEELALDGSGAFALRAAAIRLYATGTRLPAFLLAASDVCLDGRQGTTALTCSLTRLDAYDAQTYRCVLQKPVNVCAQVTDGTLRVALGDLGLSVDEATVASISRLLAAREATEAPPLQVVNETGAPLLVDGVSVEANAAATLSVDTKPRADRLGRARDGAPLAPLEVLADAYAAALPLDRRSLYGPGDGLRPSGVVASSDFVVGEYTYQGSAPTLRLRTRIRVENRCDREMALQVAGSAYQRDLPAVAPHTTFDLPLSIVREAPHDAVVCVQADDRWRPVANFEKLRAFGRSGSERVHWVDAPARCYVLASTAANTVVVCPPVALKSSLTLRARVATARRLPQSRDDYAETCVIPPNEADLSALYDVSATHWCLRVDGIEAQSAWVDITGVAARGEEAAFVVDDGRQRLRVTLNRLTRTPSLLLVLRCGLVIEDRAGLGVGVVGHVTTNARVMVDGSKHSAIQLQSGDGVSPFIVPGQLVDGRGATRIGERPVGILLEDRTLAVVPLVVLSCSVPSHHVTVRHAGVSTQDEPLPVHASTFDVSIDGADASSGWFSVNVTALQPGNVVRRFENVELVVGPRATDAGHSLLLRLCRAEGDVSIDIYVDCASTAVRVADLDIKVPRGWSLSKTGDKWALDVRALTILDGPHTTLTSTSEFFLRAAARIDRKLAARFLPGDLRVALRERCARRCVGVLQAMRRAWASEQLIETSAPDSYVVDLIRCGRFAVAPLSLVPDAAARVELAHALEDEGGVLGWAVSLLSSFPRLAVVDAELDFTGADIRPTTRRLTADGVLGEVALLYGEQLKQSWWSIATSLSLNGGAAARPPPRRRVEVEVVVPASHEKLGFSVTSTGGRLVVISVRDASPLAVRGVGPGARLLTLNGEDVAHVPPAELSARAASLAGVERRVVLTVDDVVAPPPPPGGASF
ncbi:unnamed protein product [Pelagomonas calceolata]|uniref:PDZ domain-containing protein n=1 Tax=Pelagomonas calceolata TaxID=35677 RepID=A0A8J2STF7_9STRA|nr:unnamed protein product [Pelagomonas calceolata]